MSRYSLSATAAAALALALSVPVTAQTVGGDPNRDDAAQTEAAGQEARFTVRDAMDAMRAGIENPDTAFDDIDADLDVVVVRLSQLQGSDAEMAELDAELTDSAEDFVAYHRQIAENADVSRGVEEAGYTAEDVIALWQGDEQIVLIVNDDSEEE